MINIDSLTKRYGTCIAVSDLSFEVRPGCVTGFLGPNGAGKTTTIRAILGLETPTTGRALIEGHPYQAIDRPLCQIGAVLDAGEVHGARRARDHLRWLAATNDIPEWRVDDVLQQVDLTSAARHRIATYSLGMRQRLAIAAALLGDPPILVLDEPTNGLDPVGVVWIRTLMRARADDGHTVFVSSHLLAEMALTADRIIIINRGRLVADTTVAQLAQPERGITLEDAYLRLTAE